MTKDLVENAIEIIHKFLDDHGLKRSATALSKEAKSSHNYTVEKDRYNSLVKTIGRVVDSRERAAEVSTKEPLTNPKNAPIPISKKKKSIKPMSGYEVENIMENFMNKLFMSPNLLEDEKLNYKIEKIFENRLFQKIVEEANVLEDAGDLTANSSKLAKQKGQKKYGDDDICTENNILGNILNEKTEEMVPYEEEKSNHQQQKQEGRGMKRTESVGMLLGSTNKDTKKLDDDLRDQLNCLNNESENIVIDANDDNMYPDAYGVDFIEEQNKYRTAPKNKGRAKAQNTESPQPPLDFNDKKNNDKFEKLLTNEIEKISDIGSQKANDDSQFQQQSTSFFTLIEEGKDIDDQYENDEDPGFELFEVEEQDFSKVCKHLAAEYGFPERALKKERDNRNKKSNRDGYSKRDEYGKSKSKDNSISGTGLFDDEKDLPKEKGYIYLPPHQKHPPTDDQFYPKEFERTIYDCFNLKIIYDRERTGFEETKDFPIVIGSIIAGRYQVQEYLGSAAFSKAIQCVDLTTGKHYCMKIIENNKDYFDQSIDEIKLLKYISVNGDADEKNVLKIHEFFYHKEHLFICTELLKDNLYEYYRFNKEKEDGIYFTIGRLQKITKQILIGLEYIHNQKQIHCDLKPENILIKSYSKAEVKIIDFGSSCYIHDHLSSYVQSRSYRAPEVIIGCKYDYKIDMWSLGCILCELWTGSVLFQNDTVQGLLARVIGIIGAFPSVMMNEGKLVNKFFTKNEKLLFQDVFLDDGQSQNYPDLSDYSRKKIKTGKIQILVPKMTNLKYRLRTNDMFFLDFVKQLLQIDPSKRPNSTEALKHPWLVQAKYEDGI